MVQKRDSWSRKKNLLQKSPHKVTCLLHYSVQHFFCSKKQIKVNNQISVCMLAKIRIRVSLLSGARRFSEVTPDQYPCLLFRCFQWLLNSSSGFSIFLVPRGFKIRSHLALKKKRLRAVKPQPSSPPSFLFWEGVGSRFIKQQEPVVSEKSVFRRYISFCQADHLVVILYRHKQKYLKLQYHSRLFSYTQLENSKLVPLFPLTKCKMEWG